jgi:4-amino-4-deoxy-L-arabinose transferase-like glycosyltransferase
MIKSYISAKTYYWLFGALFIAYLFGLFVPLMDEDASHHASIALHMYLNHDYVNLVSRGEDYLDKPHLHFWLAALSYNIFGVTTWAYKLPSLLMTILGAYSTYKLGKLLYSKETGLLAALIAVGAQAQILANNDVRMDALLTGSIIFATWQLVAAATYSRWYNFLFGALGLAMGFTTKGMIGFVMPCVALFCLLVYQRNWRAMFNWRWIMVFLMCVVFIAPCVYCYYLQYDLHPEKVIRGMKNISGVKFILWSQNFERLEGKSWGKGHKDYFFFFHTMLWAFLPWCLLTYHAVFNRAAFFIKNKFAFFKSTEFLTLGTIIVIFAIISSSGYQLPHYLNILFPFFAIITAGQVMLVVDMKHDRTLRNYLRVQYFVAAVVLIILVLINLWCFPIQSVIVAGFSVILLSAMVYCIATERDILHKILIVSTVVIALANVLLNGNFYQQLLTYQSGISLAKVANEKVKVKQDIYSFNNQGFAFDFYTSNIAPNIDVDGIKKLRSAGKTVWVYTNDEQIENLKNSGFQFLDNYSRIDYGVTRLTGTFLNPATRPQVLRKEYLLRIK